MAGTKRVLFVCYGGGHLNALLPVIQALRSRRPAVETEVLGLTTARASLDAAGIPSMGFKDFVTASDERALAYGRELAGTLPPGQVDPEESAAYLGLSFQDLVDKLGEAGARAEYAHKGRLAFVPVTALERVFDRVKPDLLVTTNSPRAERAAVLVARRRGVPAICLGDLWLGFELEWIGAPDYADRVLVLNEYVRDKVIRAGRDPAVVSVTGNPAFDRLADPAWREQGKRIRDELGTGSRALILWISHAMPWAPEIREAIWRSLVDAASRHPEWQLVLRAHPNEPALQLELPDYVKVSVPQSQPAPAILSATDVAVTMLSTMGLEAVMLGVPLVTTAILPVDQPSYIDLNHEMVLRNLGLSAAANTLNEIEPAIVAALRDRPDVRERLPRVGQATDAVLAQIDSFVGAGSTSAERKKC
jgi:hypothetical protein